MRVAYITSGFPVTFITNEAESHRLAGWEVIPFSSSRPVPARNLSAVELQWQKRTIYRPALLRRWACGVRELAAHPLGLLNVCIWMARLAAASPREFALAVHELGMACYSAEHCRRLDVQHIHVHFASRSLNLGLMIGLMTGRPVSCTVHAFDIFTRSDRSLRTRLSRCVFISAISRYNIEYLRRHCGEQVAGLCHVVHCGVDPALFRSISRRPVFGRLLTVSNLVAKKGLDVAVEACARLRDEAVDFQYQIVGDGPMRASLAEGVRRHRLEDHVRLIGPLPNDRLGSLLSEACAFVLPCQEMPSGDLDGIPVAMMEAMASEVPVVSTTVSGIPELVEDGRSGFLVPERDPAALVQALKRLLADVNLIARFGQAARQRVLAEFDADACAGQLRDLIAGVAADAGSAPKR